MNDFSKYRDNPAINILAQISALAIEQKNREERVAKLTDSLKEAKESLRQLVEDELPALMDEAEQKKIITSDNIEVEVVEKIRASISKDNQALAFNWLEEHGYENLIKRQFIIEFSKDDDEWATEFSKELSCRDDQLPFKQNKSVHAGTLTSFVKEQLENGVVIPQELLGVYRQRFTKISAK